jgi:hypothetical protein
MVSAKSLKYTDNDQAISEKSDDDIGYFDFAYEGSPPLYCGLSLIVIVVCGVC